jgi:hypothetical protein
MNKSQLLLELPPTLSHIVTKRGRVLRDGGSSGVSTLLSGNKSVWISTEVSDRGEATVWDLAHEVSSRLKKEFGSAVYVEPAAAGRFHYMISSDVESRASRESSYQNAPLSGIHGSAVSINQPGMGFQSAGSHMGSGRVMSMPNARTAHFAHRGVPGSGAVIPSMAAADQFDLRARHNRDGSEHSGQQRDLSCPALRSARSFKALPAASQMMFEVEASQIMSSVSQPSGQPALDDQSTLMLLAFQPGISNRLKAVLEKAIGLESLK